MSRARKNHLPFSCLPATGQVVGISQHVCQQTYPSASDLAFVTEDAITAGPRINSKRDPQWQAELSHFKPNWVLRKVRAAARR